MEKAIILNSPAKQLQLQAVLDAVQKRSNARTLTADRIIGILVAVEQELSIPKKYMRGIRVCYTGAQHFPSAYRGTPESTHFVAEYSGTAWRVTAVYRSLCPNRRDSVELQLPEAAQQAILAAHSRLCI